METEDGADDFSAVDYCWKLIDLDKYRLHTQNLLIIFDYPNESKISVDNITQFGLRPQKLRQLFNKLGYYYRWFVISSEVKIANFHHESNSNL